MPARKTPPLLLALALALAPGLAAQDDLEIGEDSLGDLFSEEAELIEEAETVVTASSYAQRIDRTPSNIYVIHREDIEALNPKHIADVLRLVPGFAVFRRAQFGHEVSALGTGWIYSNKTLVLIDGHRATDPSFGNTYWNLLPLVVSEIERVEVVVGPESALYGTNAFAAVINFITRNKAAESSRELVIRAGEHKFTEATYLHNHKSRQSNTRLTFQRDHRGALEGLINVQTLQPDPALRGGDRWGNFIGRLAVERSFGPDVQLHVSASAIQSDANGYSGAPGQGFETDSDQKGLYFTFDLDRSFTETRRLSVRSTYNTAQRNYAVGPLLPFGVTSSAYDTKMADLEFRFSDKLGSWRLTTGAGGRRSEASGYFLDPGDDDSFASSVFFYGERDIGERFVLFAGSRKDFIDYADDPFSWKVAGLYRPRRDTGYRLSVGSSFRAPDLATVRTVTIPVPAPFPTSAPILTGNPLLQSEKADLFVQLGYEREWKTARLKLDAYHADFEGLIDIQEQGPIVGIVGPPPIPTIPTGQFASLFVNTAKSEVKGLTVLHEREVGDMELTLGYNIMSREGGETPALPEVAYAPTQSGSLMLALPENEAGWGGSILVSGVSAYSMDTDTRNRNLGARGRLPGWATADVNIYHEFQRDKKLGVTARNIFDKKHIEIADTLGAAAGRAIPFGREFYVTLAMGL